MEYKFEFWLKLVNFTFTKSKFLFSEFNERMSDLRRSDNCQLDNSKKAVIKNPA